MVLEYSKKGTFILDRTKNMEPKAGKYKRTNNGLLLAAGILILCLFDFLFFRILIWKVPNESPWSSNHFYNFLYEYFTLREKQKSRPRILIVGSSIAHYSFDRESFRKEIFERTGKEVEVEFLSYAGMTPLDVWLCRNKIVELEPDFVVFPINFIDWRLHRAYSLNPSNKNETIDSKLLLLDALNFFEAPQSRFIFPLETVLAFFSELGFVRTSEYISASFFGFYRYKDIFWKNLRSLYDHRYGRNTSYHGYNGVQIPERVTSLGWTGKKFSFNLTEGMKREGFFVQIVPEILFSGPLKITFQKRIRFALFPFPNLVGRKFYWETFSIPRIRACQLPRSFPIPGPLTMPKGKIRIGITIGSASDCNKPSVRIFRETECNTQERRGSKIFVIWV
ncbi:hypothetical protein LEP1GSC043_4814 [Leptospira weilii str. Ecochallenge]|uniref:Uncharacterized protein n=1 Tax=Leptospira weilii str. Ecochallenge TaxID=1049986 RepID=N1U3Q1_9LEPT|nr:hypothetical protein LEP1GSC043_4814 [Leptospira weilii str. Ecochallenge]